MESCHREVQLKFQDRYPAAAIAWDEHSERPAGVLVYMHGEATAAAGATRLRVEWECFVDPRHNAVRKSAYKVLRTLDD